MVFRSIILTIVLSLFVIGCQNSSEKEIINELKAKNDSLSRILQELNQKYIFDSISIRDIPSHQNTYLANTNVSGEIVIVGFNKNQKTNVILADSIDYNQEIRFYNPDTLETVNGGFVYSKNLRDSLRLNGIIEFGNTHGKTHQTLYNTLIKAKNR